MSRREKRDWGLEELLSIVGFVFELVRVVVNALRKRGGTIDDLRRLLKDQALVDHVFDLIVVKSIATFSALVTYVPPSLVVLKSAFDWVDDFYATISFEPISRCHGVWTAVPREVSFEYVHLGRDASTDDVLAKMDRQGLRPALYGELLAFGAKYLDEQRKFPIVALGSVCRFSGGGLYVACLDGFGSGCGLRLLGVGHDWYGSCRFLAVRK